MQNWILFQPLKHKSSYKSIVSLVSFTTIFLALSPSISNHLPLTTLLEEIKQQFDTPWTTSCTLTDVTFVFLVEPNTSLRRSASMRHRGPVSDYLGIARKGGHHKGLSAFILPKEYFELLACNSLIWFIKTVWSGFILFILFSTVCCIIPPFTSGYPSSYYLLFYFPYEQIC